MRYRRMRQMGNNTHAGKDKNINAINVKVT